MDIHLRHWYRSVFLLLRTVFSIANAIAYPSSYTGATDCLHFINHFPSNRPSQHCTTCLCVYQRTDNRVKSRASTRRGRTHDRQRRCWEQQNRGGRAGVIVAVRLSDRIPLHFFGCKQPIEFYLVSWHPRPRQHESIERRLMLAKHISDQ